MQITVQKYGGSSVADRHKLRHVARRIVQGHREGRAIVVVVSAMGDTTDELLDLARALSVNPSHRELDMLLSAGERISTALLALAVQEQGIDAISLTGEQSGIVTSPHHFDAEIESVEPERVRRELAAGRVVIVAGFQGVSPHGETTTLGRGGSDTSAVALAAALDAERCEIFSDVDGVFTADPRIVERSSPLEVIDYEEMLELARHGATVLNAEAVKLARELDVTLRAASTFSEAPGTIVTSHGEEESEPAVKGVACHRELIRLSMEPCPRLRDEVLEAGGGPEIYLGSSGEDRHDVFVRSESVADENGLAAALAESFGERVEVEGGVGSVSAVGRGVGSAAGPREQVERLGREVAGEDPRHVTSDHALTTLLDSDLVESATRDLHDALVEPSFVERTARA